MENNFASIVPLIGGETIAMQNVFGKRPEYLMTYDGFQDNESHLVNYYNNEVPYFNLSNGQKPNYSVDVVNTVCPCAGLSSLSPSASSTNEANDWMVTSAKYVLGDLKPKVFWGENAPRLASKMGQPVVEKLKKIALQHGYTLSIFQTKSILHGLSQVRDRTFYFFWKDDKVPLFEYIYKNHSNIADDIRRVNLRDDDPMSQIITNKRKPSEDPYYKFVLEELHGGITHNEFQNQLTKTANIQDYIEERTDYMVVRKWMLDHGYEKEAEKCIRMYRKLKSGGNIMRKQTEVPVDKIGAFVGHMPMMLTHPDEDRYLTVRECLSLMGLPDDFELLNPRRSINHICQNVPVTTAEFASKMVLKYLNNSLDMIDTNFLVQDNRKKELKYQKNSLQLTEFMV